MPPPSPIPPLIPKPDDGELGAAMKRAALTAAAAAVAIAAGTQAPKTLGPAVHFFTGIEVVPGRGLKPTPALVLWVLPQPVGVVPPRVYGLPPEMGDPMNYYRMTFPAGRDRVRQARDERVLAAEAKAVAGAEIQALRMDSGSLLAWRDQLRTQELRNGLDLGRLVAVERVAAARGYTSPVPVRVAFGTYSPSGEMLSAPNWPPPFPAELSALGSQGAPGAVAPEKAGGFAPIQAGAAAEATIGAALGIITAIDRFFAANPADP